MPDLGTGSIRDGSSRRKERIDDRERMVHESSVADGCDSVQSLCGLASPRPAIPSPRPTGTSTTESASCGSTPVSKAAVFAVFVFPAALVSNLVAFEVGQRIFTSKHLQVTLGHPGVLRAIVFGAAAVSLVAVIGVGLGGVIRHTAGATTAMAVVIVGGVTLGQLLPAAMRGYLPVTAIQAVVTVHRSAGILAPGTAIVVLGVYAAITLTAASMRAAHRDA